MDHYQYCEQFLSNDSCILDIGAGKGNFLYEMSKRGYKVYGLEINPDYIDIIKNKLTEYTDRIDIICGNAESLPYSDAKFSFINVAEVTEHVDRPQRVCEEIYRVLAPAGRVYISFHNRFGIFDYHYHLWFINWLPRRWAEFILLLVHKNKEDGSAGRQRLITMHYFTFSKVKKLLEAIGFNVEDIRVIKIRERYPTLFLFFLPIYLFFLRPFYFNTFHLLLTKK